MPQLKPMISYTPNVMTGRPDQVRRPASRALFMVGCAKIQGASHTAGRGAGRDRSIRLRVSWEMGPGLRRDLFNLCGLGGRVAGLVFRVEIGRRETARDFAHEGVRRA